LVAEVPEAPGRHAGVFPEGDLAALNCLKSKSNLPKKMRRLLTNALICETNINKKYLVDRQPKT
jgi:hypothetical protein